MRILVDTSVWSLALRRGGPAAHPAVGRLRALIRAGEDVALPGIVLQEVLQAFREEDAFRRVARSFEPFEVVEPQRQTHIEAARIHRRAAAKGVAATTTDCLIAATAVRHGDALLTTDRDFERLARVCDLQLL